MTTREYKDRMSVHADTHKTLSQYKTELGTKFNERTQADKAINALDQEANFVYLNGELVNAWKKDVKGWISEGGVIGWASSFWRKSNLNKAINKIANGDTKNNIPGDPAMAQKIRNSVDMMLREHRAEIQALT